MKYVIQTDRKFDGCVYTSMSDGVHSDYGGETIDEIRSLNPEHTFEVVAPEKVEELVNKYIAELTSEPFEEIDEERYWDMMECVPPARQGRNWFFLGEAYNFDVHLFCFTDGDRYFSGHRRVSMPREEIDKEINNHLKFIKNENVQTN